ncbi:MAG TPA: DUF4166 domain-containing protein [Caulobacteraceae bacterium]|nr:DUF4166 domain-containing protein [Caulobacteraceae bacterium]
MSKRLSVLLVGGYGTLGGRIVQLLEGEPRLTLIVAGRSARKAEQYCLSRQHSTAQLAPATFDRTGDLAAQLEQLRPDILVDASGPFQSYGDGRYRLVEACLSHGVDYLDLADGSAFVTGVAAFDAQARAAGRFVLSGVSTFPVLTAAAVRRLAQGLSRVDAIRAGIAPSPFAGVGMNVIRAIAGYAGQPIELPSCGEVLISHPFTEQLRRTISPPGRIPLRSRMFSRVDVPDPHVLSELWPHARVWIGAGPVPETLHRALIACAWLVRSSLIRSLSPLAGAMHWASTHLRWGEHRGGMFVEVEGRDAEGAAVERSWHLLAEGDDGPLIPSMAVAAIVRNVLAGWPPALGARPSIRELELEDYAPLLAARAISTGGRLAPPAGDQPLYQRILGDDWGDLPPPISAMHDVEQSLTARGRASVERGRGPLAFLAGRIAGFPDAAADTALTVRFDVVGGVETWTRTFGTKSFSSRQFAGRDRWRWLLCESFGPLTFAMALAPDEHGRLSLILRGWRLFGLPLPLWLCPTSTAYEHVEDGRFAFHVEIGHPLTGMIVRYRGWLAPEVAIS